MTSTTRLVLLAVSAPLAGCQPKPMTAPRPLQAAPAAVTPTPAVAAQNPSPMQERTRRHERLARSEDAGVHFSIEGVLPKAVEVFIPQKALGATSAPLLFHFMGATWLPHHAVATLETPVVVAAAYLGAGSSVYARPFAADSLLFARLLDSLRVRIGQVTAAPAIGGIYLSGFSAGYGAIREILRRPGNLPLVDGVLLIDGIHTSYLPDGKPVAEGGVLDTTGLAPFADFARLAVAGDKRFLITHSEIFPGTFASTTESTDWLLDALGLRRVPVLEWGPMGTQLLSDTRKGRLEVMGFAGNSAPDHVDQFHGMASFVQRLLAP